MLKREVINNMREALKALRQRAGLSQGEVALALGVQQSTVAMWETGANMPRAVLLPKLADLYHCTVDELYGKEEPA